MWKKSLIASNNAMSSPMNNSWEEQSDCSIESNGIQQTNNKEPLLSPGSQVSQSDNVDSAEGIWNADIEQAFIEAMAIYPPCGRRKIILSEEGKMYGRNELIARYIKLRTGKTRTRKQVSSHIQVLGRRHAKFLSAAAFKFQTFKNHPYLSITSPTKTSLTSSIHIERCETPVKCRREGSEEKRDITSYQTPTKNFSSSECVARNLLSPLKSSSTFNSTNHREDPHANELPQNLDGNNNKFTSENCSVQFFPDSTFSPTSNSHQDKNMFNPSFNAFPPVNGGSFQCCPMQQYNSHLYNTPQDVHNHQRCRPDTPASCYSKPPMAHTYSPYVNQIWNTPTHHNNMNRNVQTPDHDTCSTSFDLNKRQRTPCMARDLTTSSHLKCIESKKLRLTELSAFLEFPSRNGQVVPQTHNFLCVDMASYDNAEFETIDINKILDKFPSNKGGLMELFERGPKEGFYLIKFWTNLNINLENTIDFFFGSTTRFESQVFCSEIQSSSKVCSFGRQVVERIEKESCRCVDNKFHFDFLRLPVCDYLINFLHKLNQLPEKRMMNSVLENFTILQVVTSVETRETLLCIGYVFEVSEVDNDIQHCIYRLV